MYQLINLEQTILYELSLSLNIHPSRHRVNSVYQLLELLELAYTVCPDFDELVEF